MTMQIFDCEQGTPEWYAARAGIPTSSEFATVMAKGKEGGASLTRARYMRKLAGEIITGEPAPEGYSNAHMERGKAMEDDACRLYAFMADAEPERVGFIRNGNKGCSPDRLVGAKRGLEIKTAIPEVQIERLIRGTLPPEHKAQVQGNIWLAERETWDFISYWPKLPMLNINVPRDDAYIRLLSDAVDTFNDELSAMIERIRNYGDPEGLRRQLVMSNTYAQNVMAG